MPRGGIPLVPQAVRGVGIGTAVAIAPRLASITEPDRW